MSCSAASELCLVRGRGIVFLQFYEGVAISAGKDYCDSAVVPVVDAVRVLAYFVLKRFALFHLFGCLQFKNRVSLIRWYVE